MYAKQNPGKPRVRFADELVFNDNVKEQDIPAVEAMLRRSSLQMDINSINSAGLTPLHQAVLDGNIAVTKLLVAHGADVNKQDEDFWTPLHAACAEGHSEIVKFLLTKGADRHIMTDNGERPLDLVEPTDFSTIKVMLEDVAAVTSPTCDSEEEEEEEEEEEAEVNAEYGAGQEGEDVEDENIRGKARILDDEDVMGDLEYISPDEDEENEKRHQRQRRSGAESCSGSGSDRGSRYRSGDEEQEDSESEAQRRRQYQRHNNRSRSREDSDYDKNNYISEDERYSRQDRQRLRDSGSDENHRAENRHDIGRSDEEASDGSTGFRRRRDPHYLDSGSEEEKRDRHFDDRRKMAARHNDGPSPRYSPEDERFAFDSDGNNNSGRGRQRYDYSSEEERIQHQRLNYDSSDRIADRREKRASRSSSGERLLSGDDNFEPKNRD